MSCRRPQQEPQRRQNVRFRRLRLGVRSLGLDSWNVSRSSSAGDRFQDDAKVGWWTRILIRNSSPGRCVFPAERADIAEIKNRQAVSEYLGMLGAIGKQLGSANSAVVDRTRQQIDKWIPVRSLRRMLTLVPYRPMRYYIHGGLMLYRIRKDAAFPETIMGSVQSSYL